MTPHTFTPGDRFGDLVVVTELPRERDAAGRSKRMISCRCDCGNVASVSSRNLTCGDVKSCGCRKIRAPNCATRTHGQSESSLYQCWLNMHARCSNAARPDFKHYGGRGIAVCAEWVDFDAFARDMGAGYRHGLTIDRKDTNGGYSLDNCRWATRAEQSRNRRPFGRLALARAALLFVLMVSAFGCDVPDWVVRGICMVETGTDWRDLGDVRGTWSRGDIGEVGPWQLSPAVLRDLRAYDRRFRVHADPVLAESLTRAWLLHLYGITGSWPEAIAAYHAGLGARHRPYAIDYANRVGAIGHSAGLQILAR